MNVGGASVKNSNGEASKGLAELHRRSLDNSDACSAKVSFRRKTLLLAMSREIRVYMERQYRLSGRIVDVRIWSLWPRFIDN